MCHTFVCIGGISGTGGAVAVDIGQLQIGWSFFSGFVYRALE